MVAVLTGDVIDSRSAPPERWLLPLREALGFYGKNPTEWEIYRGDGFQLLLDKPENSLLAAIHIKAALKADHERGIRVAIGIGTTEYRAEQVTNSNGDAFVRSGEAYEKLERKKAELALATPWEDFDEEMGLYLMLASIGMNSWHQASSEFVKARITHPSMDQNELADHLGISQSSVSSRKKRSHYDVLSQLEERYRLKIKKLD